MSFQISQSPAKTSRVQVKRNSAVLLDLAFDQLTTEALSLQMKKREKMRYCQRKQQMCRMSKNGENGKNGQTGSGCAR